MAGGYIKTTVNSICFVKWIFIFIDQIFDVNKVLNFDPSNKIILNLGIQRQLANTQNFMRKMINVINFIYDLFKWKLGYLSLRDKLKLVA